MKSDALPGISNHHISTLLNFYWKFWIRAGSRFPSSLKELCFSFLRNDPKSLHTHIRATDWRTEAVGYLYSLLGPWCYTYEYLFLLSCPPTVSLPLFKIWVKLILMACGIKWYVWPVFFKSATQGFDYGFWIAYKGCGFLKDSLR